MLRLILWRKRLPVCLQYVLEVFLHARTHARYQTGGSFAIHTEADRVARQSPVINRGVSSGAFSQAI